jgi:sphingosine kinase
MSPLEALTAMDSAETGSLYHHPSLLYLRTRAYRLSFPHASKEGKELGYVSIDGEKVEHEDFNVEVHKGLARVMVLEGRMQGSKPIQGV